MKSSVIFGIFFVFIFGIFFGCGNGGGNKEMYNSNEPQKEIVPMDLGIETNFMKKFKYKNGYTFVFKLEEGEGIEIPEINSKPFVFDKAAWFEDHLYRSFSAVTRKSSYFLTLEKYESEKYFFKLEIIEKTVEGMKDGHLNIRKKQHLWMKIVVAQNERSNARESGRTDTVPSFKVSSFGEIEWYPIFYNPLKKKVQSFFYEGKMFTTDLYCKKGTDKYCETIEISTNIYRVKNKKLFLSEQKSEKWGFSGEYLEKK